MIVNYDELEWEPMDAWALGYRFTDERYNKLCPRSLATIRPLADESARRLAEQNGLSELARQAQHGLLGNDWESRVVNRDVPSDTRAWLREKRPDAKDDVYVEWQVGGFCAAVAAWDSVVEFFDDFWYEFEILLLSDDTNTWQILFGPNDVARWRSPGSTVVEAFAPLRTRTGGPLPQVSFKRYEMLKNQGKSPAEIGRALVDDGVDALESVKILRKLFPISAKEAAAALNSGRDGEGAVTR